LLVICKFMVIFAVIIKIAWMDNNSVKENLRRFRKEAGMTQSEMADELGMSRMGYINLEKEGRTALLNEDLERIARLLGKSMEELVFGSKLLDEEGPGYGDMDGRLEEMKEKLDLYSSIIDKQNLILREQREMLAHKEELISKLREEKSI